MPSFHQGFGRLAATRPVAKPQWHHLRCQFEALKVGSPISYTINSRTPARRMATATDVVPASTNDVEAPPKINMTNLHARAAPFSPSYFSRAVQFNDDYLNIQRLYKTHSKLPMLPTEQVERVSWKSADAYRVASGERVKSLHYQNCLQMVKHLHKLHPDYKSAEVTEALRGFQRDINPFLNVPIPVAIDSFGRALGTGRRKSSVARAWVVEGTGEVQINGKTLSEAFGRIHDRESAIWALRSTGRLDKYNVWALVEGGGTTGQAEALTLAVAKGLMAHEPALKPALRKAGCVTRDRRSVERKKPGHVKARKMPAWVKR